jgi:hypothetical protein
MPALFEIEVDVASVKGVGARPKHGGKARACSRAHLFEHRLGPGLLLDRDDTRIRKLQPADVDSIAGCMFAELGTRDPVSAAALIRADAAQGGQGLTGCGDKRRYILDDPIGKRAG